MALAVFNPILDIGNEMNTRCSSKRIILQKHKRSRVKLQGNLIQMWTTKQDDGHEANRMNSF